MSGLVNDNQAGSMGGADKPAGAHAENTFQNNKIKQLVFLVRFKPAAAGGFDTGAATGMLGGVTGAIEGAVSAVEQGMASIPGLDMFIKEDKAEKSSSDTEYTYFKDWGEWDKAFTKLEKALQELNPENKTDKFEFSSTDAAGRKKDATTLAGKVKGKLGPWSDYTAKVHFIGLGHGGNVVNECTDILAKDATFSKEKWHVQSVVCVATPLYANQHLLNKAALKGKGASFSFGSPYDLTQAGIACFENNEKLLKLIQDSNKNTLSLMIGKVKMRIINALSIILSGLHLSGSDTSELKKFGKIKDEVEGLVKDVVDLLKKLITEGTSFVKLGDLPEFAKLMNGYDAIPGKAVDRITKAISEFTDNLGKQAKSANVSLSPQSLAGLLNCLCPLFDTIAQSISVFKYASPTGNELSKQIADSAGAAAVYAPAAGNLIRLDVDPEYTKKAIAANAVEKPQMAGALVSRVNNLLTKAAARQTAVSSMNAEELTALAETITVMVQPMLPTKKKFYDRLLNAVPFDLAALTKEYTANGLMAIPGGGLSAIGIDFPAELKASVARADAEISRVRGYFERTDYTLPEDTLYFIYNQHNLALKKMWGPVAACIDSQTGYRDFMRSKGFDAQVSNESIVYKKTGEEEKTNVMPAKELPAGEPA